MSSQVTDASVVKVSFNLPKGELDALRDLAARRHMNMTQALRQAIQTELFIEVQVRDGGKVLIEDRNGRQREVVFFTAS
jgi:hypothetical protein